MRQKEWKLVITFPTTSAAMAAEKACMEASVSGRLIPVPREITAGCGLAWAAKVNEEKDTIEVLERAGISFSECRKMII